MLDGAKALISGEARFDGGHEIPAGVLREGFRWMGSL